MTRVRIEREVCTGAGDCARAVPDVFWIADDGLAMVQEDAAHFGEAQRFEDHDDTSTGFTAWARVPESLETAVEEAASNCPGTCIVVEHDQPAVEAEPETSAEPEPEPDPAPAPPRSSMYKRIRFRLARLLK